MDGGAWQGAVHGVAKSRTQLRDSLSLFTFLHWRRKWHPTPVILPGESQGWGSLVGCCLWGRTESDTTEVTQQQPGLHCCTGFFSRCGEQGLLSTCSEQASHFGGFSSCRTRPQGSQDSVVVAPGL